MTDLCTAALAFARGNNPDLTVRQIALLGLVCDEPGQSNMPLAVALGVCKPVITRARRSLEAAGLVAVAPREDDARKIAIVPTAAGVALRLKLGSSG